MTEIVLNRQELRSAAYSGVERRLNGIERNLPAMYGRDLRKTEWQNDVVGAIAEYAVAKYLNVCWNPATNNVALKDLPGDVGTYQVRSTTWPNGCLLIQESDKDEAPFILAVVNDRSVTLKGWVYGHEGKTIGDLKEYGTRWVKQEQLHSMDFLP